MIFENVGTAREERVRLVLLLRGMKLRWEVERTGDEVVSNQRLKGLVAEVRTVSRWDNRAPDYEGRRFHLVWRLGGCRDVARRQGK
jgi:hypothetical protein